MTLTVTTPATDRTLLTIAELRDAVGVSDSSKDAKLTTLGNRVAAVITSACKVRAGGAVPPTLRLETITETFRSNGYTEVLILSRRPVVSITSLTEVSSLLVEADYVNSNGALERLSGGSPSAWASGLITAVYTAGWQIVPDELKLAAAKLAQSYWTEDTREPGLRSFDIPGVYSASYQDKESDNPAVPSDVMQILKDGGFVNYWI